MIWSGVIPADTLCMPLSNMSASPWMTVQEAAAYARRHPQTLYESLHEYARTKGKRGLRGVQRVANGTWRVKVEDVDRWLAGDGPRRRKPSAVRS